MFIDFRHATLKDGHSPRLVTIVSEQIFGFFVSAADGSTQVFGPGGVCIPVLEKPEEVKIKILGAKKTHA